MYWIHIEKIGYISKISDIFDFFDIFDFLEKIMIFSIPDIASSKICFHEILVGSTAEVQKPWFLLPYMRTSYSWEGKGRYGSFRLRIECVSVQVKLWDPLRTRAISERFWGDDSRIGDISSVPTFTFTFTNVALNI